MRSPKFQFIGPRQGKKFKWPETPFTREELLKLNSNYDELTVRNHLKKAIDENLVIELGVVSQ